MSDLNWRHRRFQVAQVVLNGGQTGLDGEVQGRGGHVPETSVDSVPGGAAVQDQVAEAGGADAHQRLDAALDAALKPQTSQ